MYMFSKHGSTWSTDSTHNLSVSLKYKAWQAWLFTDNTAFILYYLFSGLTVACGLSETPCHTEGRPALWQSTRWHGLNWPRQHAWAIISLPKPHIKPCIARHCTDDKIFQALSLFCVQHADNCGGTWEQGYASCSQQLLSWTTLLGKIEVVV